jgi:hypothetical protein
MSITIGTAPPLTDAATADDITAAADRDRKAAAAARERAGQDSAEAEQLLEEARREAAAIIAAAEELAHPLTTSAAAGMKQAELLAGRAQQLGKAAALASKAEASEARAQALRDERDELAAAQSEIGRRIAPLAAERRDLEARLAAATESADLDLMTSLRGRLDSVHALTDALRAQQAPLLARLAGIGVGDETFSTHPLLQQLPPLAEARRLAGMDRRAVREALNNAFPDRPEAVADAGRLHEHLVAEARAEQLAAERARQAPRRQQVYLA